MSWDDPNSDPVADIRDAADAHSETAGHVACYTCHQWVQPGTCQQHWPWGPGMPAYQCRDCSEEHKADKKVWKSFMRRLRDQATW